MSKFWKAIVWTLFIAVLSLIPFKSLPEVKISNLDKLVHLVFYFVQVLLLLFAFNKNKPIPIIKYYLLACLIGIATGGILELLQKLLTINRMASWYDFLFNMLGAFLAILLFRHIRKLAVRIHIEKYL